MPRSHHRPRPLRVSAAAVGLGLVIGLAAGPAAAQRDTDTDRQPERDRVAVEVRQVDVRPERPKRDLEVLRMRCEIADGESDVAGGDAASDATRVHIGCRWRAATSERAAGYQLWRIVDRGDRELVARGGLDMLGARDVVSADAHLVRYAVIAVDEDGRRVGQSRVQRVVITEVDDHDRRLAGRARADRPSSR